MTVTDPISGNIIRTFQMTEGVVVRETFLLDNGRTVGASQKDRAVFWDLETGREIGRIDQRVYGFSEDEKKLWTFGSRGLLVYSYPELIQTCQLTDRPAREGGTGPGKFQFSPDSRFLVIYFSPGRPAADEDYPEPGFTGIIMGPGSGGFRSFFELQTCQSILHEKHYGFPNPAYRGQFSLDSRFYEIEKVPMPWERRVAFFTFRLNLETYEVEQIFERFRH
ncbi:MAG: hypothetical protein SVX43_05975 [Cyanobacteriota bacterium]|nr:hypothetical protein [Cyanobacteriota bacterium]